MTEPIFPTLPGLGWSASKMPRFAARTQKAISGRELRVLDQPYPIWTWTLTFPFLRDKNDIRSAAGLVAGALGAGFDELRTLAGFFLQRQGAFQSFIFNDPTDNSVLAQPIGTGDNTKTVFQLVRTFGGFVEPITAPNVVSHVYISGIDHENWTVDHLTGLVTFDTAPGNTLAITADFTYYFRVRFADDMAEFENFLYQLWTLKQIKIQSVLS